MSFGLWRIVRHAITYDLGVDDSLSKEGGDAAERMAALEMHASNLGNPLIVTPASAARGFTNLRRARERLECMCS